MIEEENTEQEDNRITEHQPKRTRTSLLRKKFRHLVRSNRVQLPVPSDSPGGHKVPAQRKL